MVKSSGQPPSVVATSSALVVTSFVVTSSPVVGVSFAA